MFDAPLETVEKMVQHSLCFALLRDSVQVGFARAVTDYTVFSWVADLVVDPKLRRAGLGKWVMSVIMEHPQLRTTQFVLQTRDAHELYERYGFSKNEALMSTSVPGSNRLTLRERRAAASISSRRARN